jgi:predicted transposase/invertase (TIGR01784 family)
MTENSQKQPKDRTIVSFDYAIKYILRDKAYFGILEGFLSELLERKVTVMELLESESEKDDSNLKTNRVDLKAKIDDGELAIFEIQFATHIDFLGKVLYDACKAIVEQIPKGGKYIIKKVYMINIAYFELGAKQEYLFKAKMSGFKGVHYDDLIPFSQKDELAPPPSPKSDIHPEYYLILPKKFDEEIKSKFDEWIYTLKTSIVKSEFTAAGVQEAGESLELLKMTDKERQAYDRYIRNITDDDTVIETARMEGEEQGRIQGFTEGEVKGRKEGIQEEKIVIAKNLKAVGIDVDIITGSTVLSVDDVMRL